MIEKHPYYLRSLSIDAEMEVVDLLLDLGLIDEATRDRKMGELNALLEESMQNFNSHRSDDLREWESRPRWKRWLWSKPRGPLDLSKPLGHQ